MSSVLMSLVIGDAYRQYTAPHNETRHGAHTGSYLLSGVKECPGSQKALPHRGIRQHFLTEQGHIRSMPGDRTEFKNMSKKKSLFVSACVRPKKFFI